jgi:hypothetical protein
MNIEYSLLVICGCLCDFLMHSDANSFIQTDPEGTS